MAQKTQLMVYGLPGQVQSFLAKAAAVAAVIAKAFVCEARTTAFTVEGRTTAFTVDERTTTFTVEAR